MTAVPLSSSCEQGARHPGSPTKLDVTSADLYSLCTCRLLQQGGRHAAQMDASTSHGAARQRRRQRRSGGASRPIPRLTTAWSAARPAIRQHHRTAAGGHAQAGTHASRTNTSACSQPHVLTSTTAAGRPAVMVSALVESGSPVGAGRPICPRVSTLAGRQRACG